MSKNTVAKGTKVRYHGSLGYKHGNDWYVYSSYPTPPYAKLSDSDQIRYHLVRPYPTKMDGDDLVNVRPGSFTVLDPGEDSLDKTNTGYEGMEEDGHA